jgi:fatty acid desaturase
MKIFKNSKLDFFLVMYAIIGIALPFVISSFDVIYWLLLTPIQVVFMVVIMNTSMHHHTHVPIFRNSHLNRVYELILSAATFMPFQFWKYTHLVHHRYNNDVPVNGVVKDPLSFYRFGKDGKPENFWSYVVMGLVRDLSGEAVNDLRNTCSTKYAFNQHTKARSEKLAILFFMLTIMIVSFWYAVYYMLVVILALLVNNANSYGEHYQAVDPSDFRCDSVGSYSVWFNFLCFNSGFHQEHHVKPGLHWTRLPELTETLPKNRKTINGMYIVNAPLINDFKELFK